MIKNLTIAARKSDLARLQAYAVGKALKKVNSSLEISYLFSASAGDKEQDRLLSSFGDKGAFTQDFHQGLVNEEFDLVVHSWKDLPIEDRTDTVVCATLPREDLRDLLLFKKAASKAMCAGQLSEIKVLSSSPRRVYNLKSFLPQALPGSGLNILFEPVRGNIQTRIKKLVDGDSHGVVVAKAALDRILNDTNSEFNATQKQLRSYLEQCQIMVLPLCENPAAPAQGALAIEVKLGRNELIDLVKKINCKNTYGNVIWERQILKKFGGGCHQKIGASVIDLAQEKVFSLKGLTDQGETLSQFHLGLIPPIPLEGVEADMIFPQLKEFGNKRDFQWGIQRSLISSAENLAQKLKTKSYSGLFVARANALPEGFQASSELNIWCSGVDSWYKLARRGYWVNGCSEGLGSFDPGQLQTLLGEGPWLKLTHSKGADEKLAETFFTYELDESSADLEGLKTEFEGKKYFFWMSGSHFERALKLSPQIKEGLHFCGPGQTAKILQKHLPKEKLRLFVNYKNWVQWLLNQSK